MLGPMRAGVDERDDTSSGVQLSEIVGSIAVASDLGLGQPLDHVLRSCVIATRIAERHFDEVWEKLAPAWTAFPLVELAELSGLGAPSLVVAADRDMVTIEHAATVVSHMPDARLAVLPGEHSVPIDKPGLVAAVVVDFLAGLDAPA